MATTTHEPRIGVRTLRAKLSATLRRVHIERERILILDGRGKGVAALVSVEDLAALEAMEDRIDAEAAEKALAEMEAKGEKPIPWETVKARLGL
jgi:PHD/YefM family antitoxin component YafN of YafNO toxin-antitoxin module